MGIFGNRVVRSEDRRLITGRGRFVANRAPEESLNVCFVRSTYAHAVITKVDVAAALAMPGVVDVFTGREIDLDVTPLAMMAPGLVPEGVRRSALARDRVRFAGEPIAVVIAATVAQAVDASEAVLVEYQALAPVTTVEDALRDDVLLFPEAGTNTLTTIPRSSSSDALGGSDIVVTRRLRFPRIAPVPLEGRSVAATWDGKQLTMRLSAQGTMLPQMILAASLGLDPGSIRLIIEDVGGAFGAKALTTPEEVVVAWVAKHLGRPVRWAETRSENLLGMPHGRGQQAEVSLGLRSDGTFTGLAIELVQDAGAYPDGAMMLPNFTRAMAAGPYALPQIDWSSKVVATNATPISAFRGAGRPEATFFLERIIDAAALVLGVDPGELRRKNLLPSEAFPHTTAMGTTYDSGSYADALDQLVSLSGYHDLREEQAKRRQAGDRRCLGLGLAIYVEMANPGGSSDATELTLGTDGRFVLTSPATPYGQGLETTFAQIAASRLGVPIDHVAVRHGDTAFVMSPGTGGSKSTQTWGVLADRSAVALIDAARGVAASLLEASPDDVVFDDARGSYHVIGTPARALGWIDLAGSQDVPLAARETAEFTPTYPFGAHLCVVEVDTETGQVDLRAVFGVDDCGRVVNPMLVEGQIHGGLAQGLAFGLMEHVAYDSDGNPLTANLADYAFPSAAELPFFQLASTETPAPGNELGLKGAGELGALGSTCAVANAVIDALVHLGVSEISVPVRPEGVWRALENAGSLR